MAEPVSYACVDGVGQVTLDRPKVNAYDRRFHEVLRSAVDQAEADDAATIIVLRSALPNVFCVGADVKAWAANSDDENAALVAAARASTDALASSNKLVIAHIAGHALGGGLELALACDLILCAAGDYQLGVPEVKLGLMPGNGGVARLVRRVGPSQATLLATTGISVTPTAALATGLVDAVLEPHALADLLRSLATGPRQALAAIKQTVAVAECVDLASALQTEHRHADALLDTADAREGAAAFAEKRPPSFGRASR
ncbi:MAG: enoyl-CoA hydratase/isomerase family protein [Planctomycetota bacterium]